MLFLEEFHRSGLSHMSEFPRTTGVSGVPESFQDQASETFRKFELFHKSGSFHMSELCHHDQLELFHECEFSHAPAYFRMCESSHSVLESSHTGWDLEPDHILFY